MDRLHRTPCYILYIILLCHFYYIILYFSHATEVMDTEGWRTMTRDHSHLIADAFRALASHQNPIPGPPKKRLKSS